MKIKVDDKDCCSLSEIQKKVIMNDIPSEIFFNDMKRRLFWCCDHPCDVCFDKHKGAWKNELKNRGHKSAPLDKLELAAVYFNCCPMPLEAEQEKDLCVCIDDQEAFRVSPLHKRMIKFSGEQDPDEYLMARMKWILPHKYERCLERLRLEWEPRLAKQNKAIPLDDDEFAELVFSQPDYMDRSARDALAPEYMRSALSK